MEYSEFGDEIVADLTLLDGTPLTVAEINAAVASFQIDDIPVGTTINYVDGTGASQTFTSMTGSTSLPLTGADVGTQIESLTITAPPESDVDFVLSFIIETSDPILDDFATFPYEVIVDANADLPEVVSADPIVILENNDLSSMNVSAPVLVVIDSSSDSDDVSEDLSVTFQLPFSGGAPVGELDFDVTGPSATIFVWTPNPTTENTR